MRDTWLNWGRNVGVLGFPKGAPSADPASGNYTQQFQGGVITVSGGVGRGFPKGAPSADPASGNYTQQFQGGVITVSGGVGRYP
ncbi:hypothetical protein ASF40_14815 [Microbacterium sp. Leaf288]|nr:hypothetical protein ASF40_14815 [Microbacterium sp. Leaf288]